LHNLAFGNIVVHYHVKGWGKFNRHYGDFCTGADDPALRALGLPKAGLHAFRRGCNQRWQLSGLNPAVLRQQMGHCSEKMTALYTGQIPLGEVKAAFSKVQSSAKSGNKIDVLENMENEPAA
jgi:integrase